MRWECSECGETTESASKPMRCAACGLASAFFSKSGPPDEHWRAAWLQRGASMKRDVGAPAFLNSNLLGPGSLWA
jgi:hypothetical protein